MIRTDHRAGGGPRAGVRPCGGLALAFVLLASLSGPASHAAEQSDDWVEGFAAGSLAREFQVVASEVAFADGTLRVRIERRPRELKLDTLVRSLLGIEGVERVEIFTGDGSGIPIARGSVDEFGDVPPAAAAEADENGAGLFPADKLFEPLRADPRWPRFTVGVLAYLDDPELDHVATVSFGETFPLVRFDLGDDRALDLGIQGGVFSVFDLDASSFDLVNSDFVGAVFASIRKGDLSANLRFYHQSSHLGDEFLLRNRANRVNLSFEVLELLAAWDVTDWMRVYGGGAVLIHREPALERGMAQLGLDLESPSALMGGWLRPLASFDVQFREEGDWADDLSLRWGFQVEHPRLRRMKLRLLADYYRGRSPNGQFFVRRIETVGIALHASF